MSINFPKAEEEVIQLWRDIDAFQTQVRLNEGNEPFIFYDGPPFGMLWTCPVPACPFARLPGPVSWRELDC